MSPAPPADSACYVDEPTRVFSVRGPRRSPRLPAEEEEEAETQRFFVAPRRDASAPHEEVTRIRRGAGRRGGPSWAGRYAPVELMRVEGAVRVHRVRDRVLGRELMLRELAPAAGALARHRFKREAWLGARLLHPGLLLVHDCGTDGRGRLRWFVSDILRGQNLETGIEKRARRGRSLAVPLTLDLFRETLRTLHYLHSSGVVHRDIRPAHLWITRDPNTGQHQAKLLGLGACWRVGEPHGVVARVVEARFAAPEQLAAAGADAASVDAGASPQPEIDRRVDIFAVGACMGAALLDATPLSGSGALDVALRRVIGRACAYDPKDRFADALEMEAAIQACGFRSRRPKPRG